MNSYKSALDKIIKIKLSIQNELISTNNSLNRVAAKNILSKINYPSNNNTAFDGFAFNSNETNKLSKKNLKKFRIIKTLAAGDNPNIKKVKKFWM